MGAPQETPPPARDAAGGRAKRKISKPGRFNTPPSAKKTRSEPANASNRAAGSKSSAGNGKSATAAASAKASMPPPPRQRKSTSAPASVAAAAAHAAPPPGAGTVVPAPADSGVSALALAALSSPSAAAFIGQSPVPAKVVADAMAAAKRARRTLASPGGAEHEGLTMLLEASEESPFRSDFDAAAGVVAGSKGNGRKTGATGRSHGSQNGPQRARGATSPLRPLSLNAFSARGMGSPDVSTGWGDASRRKRTTGAGRASVATAMKASASATAARRAPAAPVTAAQAAANSQAAELAPAVHAVATAAPTAVLSHALRWIDLLVADLKGRGAALRRSRRRLQKVKIDLVGAGASSASDEPRDTPEEVAPEHPAAAVEERTLLRDLDHALEAEGRSIDALLKQSMELRTMASCDGSVAAPGSKAAEASFGPTASMLGAPPPLNDAKKMTDYFRDAAVASAAAFISTGLKVAAAEGFGDVESAAAVACPGGTLPTPHIACASGGGGGGGGGAVLAAR